MRVAMLLRAAPVALLLSSTAAFATTAPLTPGNIVAAVSGVGATGSTIPFVSGAATGLSLYQYTPTGTGTATFAGKSLVTGSVNPISSEYGSSSEGLLQRSGDGKSLTIMGYAIDAATYNGATTCTPAGSNNCTNSYVPQTTVNKDKYAALAQTSSVANTSNGQGGTVIPISRVIANITADGNVDTSTALMNVFDQNNPRSVWTQDGSNYYVSGQGLQTDTTGGVFYATKGATTATQITGKDTTGNTANQDTRDVVSYGGKLYVTEDTKGGSNSARSYVGTEGSGLPTTLTGAPNPLQGFGGLSSSATQGKGLVTIGTPNGVYNGNTLNSAAGSVNLSPEQMFMVLDANGNPTTMYVTDTGASKQNSPGIGDGGLQKWVLKNGSWTLAYTISQVVGAGGTQFVASNNSSITSGVTGLFGLAGLVNGDGTVSLYATSYTLGDTDTSFLYSITDTLASTGPTSGQDVLNVVDSLTGSKFMGVAFAPDAQPVPEPASWMMMIGGFGLVGGAARRRRVALA